VLAGDFSFGQPVDGGKHSLLCIAELDHL
jgi:hypothetical protein